METVGSSQSVDGRRGLPVSTGAWQQMNAIRRTSWMSTHITKISDIERKHYIVDADGKILYLPVGRYIQAILG